MRQFITVGLSVVVLSIVITGAALGNASAQGQRPFMTRTVFSRIVDPNAKGDVVIDMSGDRHWHYASFKSPLASLSDPPLVELFTSPDPNVLSWYPPSAVVSYNQESAVNLVSIRDGQFLVLYKAIIGTQVFNWITASADGKIHMMLVVAK